MNTYKEIKSEKYATLLYSPAKNELTPTLPKSVPLINEPNMAPVACERIYQ